MQYRYQGVIPVAASQAGSLVRFRLLGQRCEFPLAKLFGIGTAGTSPLNLLLETSKYHKLERLLSEGIVPVSWLEPTWKHCKLVRPLSVGIVPVNWLTETSKYRETAE